MRCAIYARVSTSEQHPETQLAPLREAAEARGLRIVAEHVDHGVSGAKVRRPGLDALMAACRAGEVDVVVTVRLDRLARSVRHLVTLGEELRALGVDLVCTAQSIDTTTPAGKLLFHILASVGEFERDLIVERTKAGMAAARARGKKPGPARRLGPADVAEACRLLASGATFAETRRTLGVSGRTVRRALERA